MPKPQRPDDLTEEFIQGCRQMFLASTEIPEAMKRGNLGDVLWEVWLSGAWLRGQLLDAGCPEDQVVNISFAHGQMCMGRDPWFVARAVLSQYQKGFAPKAGPALAQTLLNGEPVPVYRVDGEEEEP